MNLKLSQQIKIFNYETRYCYLDGGKIPVVFKEKSSKGTNFMFSWCFHCGLAFGYIGYGGIENQYQLVASFYWNKELSKAGIWMEHLSNYPSGNQYPFSPDSNALSALVELAFNVKGLEISQDDILTLKLFADEVFSFVHPE